MYCPSEPLEKLCEQHGSPILRLGVRQVCDEILDMKVVDRHSRCELQQKTHARRKLSYGFADKAHWEGCSEDILVDAGFVAVVRHCITSYKSCTMSTAPDSSSAI